MNIWSVVIHENYDIFSSVQFSRSVISDSLQPHESQHARPPCPSPTPEVHSDSRPSSPWCHPAISSCVVPFSSCPQSLPASKSFPMSQLFAWGGQSTGISALASFLPKPAVNHMGSRPPNSDHDLFWCKFDFWKCCEVSSWSSLWGGHSLVVIKKSILSHITTLSRNGSLLCRIRKDDTSK